MVASFALVIAALGGARLALAMPITGILVQDEESQPFDLEGGMCYAFSVEFEGGKNKKFKVAVTDSAKGLSYIAAGIGRYNNKDVAGGPDAFQDCDADEFDAAGARPTCWGDNYLDVSKSGFEIIDDTVQCTNYFFPYRMQLGADEDSEFKFRASNSDGCKTESGTYYLYVYADEATTVTFDVSRGSTSKKNCDNEKALAIVILIIIILCCCCCCMAIVAGIFFCLQAAKKKPSATNAPAGYTQQGQTPGQAYSGAQDWGTGQPYGQPQPGPVQVGAGTAAQPIQGTVVGGPIQGTVVAGAPSAPAKPAYGDAPPAYGA